jgi:hypothetical protein
MREDIYIYIYIIYLLSCIYTYLYTYMYISFSYDNEKRYIFVYTYMHIHICIYMREDIYIYEERVYVGIVHHLLKVHIRGKSICKGNGVDKGRT